MVPLHHMPACDCELPVDGSSVSGYGDPRGRVTPCMAGGTVYSVRQRCHFRDSGNGTGAGMGTRDCWKRGWVTSPSRPER